jgi:hypothetical protein
MGDGYIRIRRTGPEQFGPCDGRNPLLFVDVDDGADVATLRDVADAYLAAAAFLVLRTKARRDEVVELLRRLDVRRHAGCLRQEIGEVPTIDWVDPSNVPSPDDQADVILRCRRIELRALLNWGGAVWTAAKHHYLLPSGRHASAFIKSGHAVGEPRDAEVLASWLYDRLHSERPTSVVVDSGTLSSVALALRLHAGPLVDEVAILERYPATDVDVERVVDSIVKSGRVAALISVCSSGTLRDRLRNVFGHMEPRPLAWTIDTLVDLKPDQAHFGKIRSWVALPRDDNAIVVESPATDCALCRDHERALVIPVDPRTFDAYIPTLRERQMLDLHDAANNKELWEACARTKSVLVEATPDEHVRLTRRTGEALAVKLTFTSMLDDTFIAKATNKLRGVLASARDLAAADMALVPQADVERPGYDDLWAAIAAQIPALKRHTIPKGDWSPSFRDEVRNANHIIVLALGSVTGASLQRTLHGVQRCRQGSSTNYLLSGLVVHGRPELSRDWQTLKNAYANRLWCLWRSYLPFDSPLRDESELIERVPMDDASAHALAFWEARRLICGGRDTRPAGLFWGANEALRLTPHSFFGEDLDQYATYAAVSSSMQSIRQKQIDPPHQRAFELPAVFRSFYDPLIVCSVLRWITPPEAWWGPTPIAATTVAFDLLERVRDEPEIQAMVSAELLVANALGKIPEAAANDVVIVVARRLLDAFPDWGFLEVALRLPKNRRSLT